MRRSGVPAHRQPRRRAGASGVSGAGRHQPRQRLSRARHAAGGRPDDPAGGHRAVLVARHHRHDLHRGRERDRLRAMPGWCCRFRPGCRRARRSSWWRRRSMSSRCCSAVSAAWSGRCFPAGISKRERRCDATFAALAGLSLPLADSFPLHAQERLNVVASFSILGDFVKNVGGDRVERHDAGRSRRRRARLYAGAGGRARRSRTPSCSSSTASASKAGCRGWCSPPAARPRSSPRPTASRRSSIGADADPHAWQSVANAKIYVANIRDALVAADPAGCRGLSRQCGGLSGQARRARPRGAGGRGANPAGAAAR